MAKTYYSAELNKSYTGTRADAIRQALSELATRAVVTGFYGRFAFRAADDSGFVLVCGSGSASLAHKWNKSKSW